MSKRKEQKGQTVNDRIRETICRGRGEKYNWNEEKGKKEIGETVEDRIRDTAERGR